MRQYLNKREGKLTLGAFKIVAEIQLMNKTTK